ncbi:MAG: septal ring lytic transglycosylase RlpA family protein [Verrucomicrobia bacterium]|nr:septal ring lytic transglycosylase RlpA family protein [Verrucomicrobiota bacterium]
MVRSGEAFTGKVSWYSVRTNGGTRTASGEHFADHHDTAAHRTLPFGTLVEVTNLANEEKVILRINDRGPFKHGRVLDVSIGAAKKLGFDKQGLASCRIEVLKPKDGSETGDGSEAEGGE